MKQIIIIFILIVLLSFPLFTEAVLIEGNDTEVINEIKVEASTGNNKVEDGEVIEGESKSSVEIKTIINGEELESISTESESESIEVNLSAQARVVSTMKIWWLDFINSFKSIFKKIFSIF